MLCCALNNPILFLSDDTMTPMHFLVFCKTERTSSIAFVFAFMYRENIQLQILRLRWQDQDQTRIFDSIGAITVINALHSLFLKSARNWAATLYSAVCSLAHKNYKISHRVIFCALFPTLIQAPLSIHLYRDWSKNKNRHM